MAEKPILLNRKMIQAILSGRKTQTRRVMRSQPINTELSDCLVRANSTGEYEKRPWFIFDDSTAATIDIMRQRRNPAMSNYLKRPRKSELHKYILWRIRRNRGRNKARWSENEVVYGLSPYGIKKDSIWVRETFSVSDNLRYMSIPFRGMNVWYRANNNRPTWAEGRWKPSIHMPRWASRITLEVTDVRIERVRDISENDAKAEGVEPSGVGRDLNQLKYRASFMTLWDEINAKRGYSWESNPWVWVVEFSLSGRNDSQLQASSDKTEIA